MNTQNKNYLRHKSKTTAAEWFVKLHADQVPAEAEEEFRKWLNEDPEHEKEYRECEVVETLVYDLQEVPELRPYIAECVELVDRHRGNKLRQVVGKIFSFTSQRIILASLITVVVTAILSLLIYLPKTYQTGIGEQRTIVLPDRSTVTLNTNTKLSVVYSSRLRSLRLKRGEAFFSVVHEPSRPFEVKAETGVVRAVGTAFGIVIDKGKVNVSVLEGSVEVKPVVSESRDGVEVISQLLLGGESFTYWSAGIVAQVDQADTRRINAWREGKLDFNEVRLADAIEEHNRYTTKKIIIGSEDIKNLTVSGVFHIGDTESLIFLLEKTLGLRAVRQSNVIILLRPLSSQQAIRPSDISQKHS